MLFYGATNCWARDLRILDSDNGVLVAKSDFITAAGQCHAGWRQLPRAAQRGLLLSPKHCAPQLPPVRGACRRVLPLAWLAGSLLAHLWGLSRWERLGARAPHPHPTPSLRCRHCHRHHL